jgi:hypothetical protein
MTIDTNALTLKQTLVVPCATCGAKRNKPCELASGKLLGFRCVDDVTIGWWRDATAFAIWDYVSVCIQTTLHGTRLALGINRTCFTCHLLIRIVVVERHSLTPIQHEGLAWVMVARGFYLSGSGCVACRAYPPSPCDYCMNFAQP